MSTIVSQSVVPNTAEFVWESWGSGTVRVRVTCYGFLRRKEMCITKCCDARGNKSSNVRCRKSSKTLSSGPDLLSRFAKPASKQDKKILAPFICITIATTTEKEEKRKQFCTTQHARRHLKLDSN